MKSAPQLLQLAGVTAMLTFAGCAGTPDRAAEADVRAMPQFEVDPAWPLHAEARFHVPKPVE
jgi:hypothetical protein